MTQLPLTSVDRPLWCPSACRADCTQDACKCSPCFCDRCKRRRGHARHGRLGPVATAFVSPPTPPARLFDPVTA